MVKSEDMGMGLPKNNDGNDSLYIQSLNSASAFESRVVQDVQMHLTLR